MTQMGVVNSLAAGVVVDVGPDGTIWGTGKYEQLDPGWAEALAVFLESLITEKHPFIANPATIQIPENPQIGLVGDWGTGNWKNAVKSGSEHRRGQPHGLFETGSDDSSGRCLLFWYQ